MLSRRVSEGSTAKSGGVVWAAFDVSLMVLGFQVSRVAALQESPGLEIPMSYPYYGMVLGGVYLFFVSFRRIFLKEKSTA